MTEPQIIGARVVTSTVAGLHPKARRLAERELVEGEQVITAFAGRSKQAMIVTDQRLLMVKPGIMSGVWLGRKTASFPLAAIATTNVHTGRGVAAIELVLADDRRPAKPDLATAYQQPNWLPCHPALGASPLMGELRTFVESNGRSRSARAELMSSSSSA